MNNNGGGNAPKGALNASLDSNYGSHVAGDRNDIRRLPNNVNSWRLCVIRIRAIKSKHNFGRYHRIDSRTDLTNAEMPFVFRRRAGFNASSTN